MRLEYKNLTKTDYHEQSEEIWDLISSYGTHLDNLVTCDRPMQEISFYIAKMKPKAAIIQKDVQDPDYLAEHAVYYSKFTRKINRYCTRIHFFSESNSTDDIVEVIDYLYSRHVEEKNKGQGMGKCIYLGFVTLRPIAMCPIGATILEKPNFDGFRQFVITSDKFEVNLSGRTFTVLGTPYLQQDNAVGACAQASIWMALRTIRQKEGQSAYTTAQISDAATRYILHERALPNKAGLSIHQMNEAIRSTGYIPHTINFPEKFTDPIEESNRLKEIKQVIYSYIESGIPVILILKDRDAYHAVTAIGHGWTESPREKIKIGEINLSGKNITIYDAASWVSPFIIHNDNTGPYREFNDIQSNDYYLGNTEIAIPIIHETDFIDSSAARKMSYDLFKFWMDEGTNGGTNGGSTEAELPDLVFRTYLMRRSEFRKEVIGWGLSEKLKRYYRLKWLPGRFWVTEINSVAGYGQLPSQPSRRLGLILIDVASEAVEYQASLLSIYFDKIFFKDGTQGVIIDHDVNTDDLIAEPINTDIDFPRVRRF